MRPLHLSLLLTLLCTCVRAQKAYFQQDLAYAIDATLNDRTHELRAKLELTYVNNSPDTIGAIPFHCYPRAYSTNRSSFARQMLRHGSTEFHFAKPEDRGTMDSLDFRVNGGAAEWVFDTVDPDIAHVTLPQPLLPGGRVTITTPFRVKIPKSFSRMGRVGESYQVTQWYPKPAVYDRSGFHPQPYLNLGEYYAEFATYDVRLTLPENYVVGATGVLTTPAERDFLLQKAGGDRAGLERRAAAGDLPEGYVPETFPASAAQTKTISYRAERVHDFAWFADKRFKVLHDTLQLAGRSEPVDVWAMFNETEAGLWVKATDYLKRATRFYSDQLGVYPFPQVTGVMSALSVGGGMEYPMITVIGLSGDAADLDEVLAHEVGHNWFQGILGSNERDHPWMDEGLNSFYEQRYMKRYYPERGDRSEMGPFRVNYDNLGYRYFARQGRDQPPGTRSDSLAEMNYWIGSYSKPALAMRELESIVGTDSLDRAMRAYYEAWKFKHPQPADFFSVIDGELQRKTEPWFSQAFLTTKTSDHVRNRNLDPKPQKGDRRVPDAKDAPYNRLDLYPNNEFPGLRVNSFGLGTAQEELLSNQYFGLPLLGFNEHDGPLLGVALHNRTLEPRRFEWLVAPMYGFESGRLNGFLGMRLRTARAGGRVRQRIISAGVQRFSDFTLRRTDAPYAYQRFALRGELMFRHAPITETESGLVSRVLMLRRDRPDFNDLGEITGGQTNTDYFWRVSYHRANTRELTPLAYNANLEWKAVDEETPFNAGHLKLEGELTGGYQYEPEKFVRYRFFGGVFLINELRESSGNIASGFSLVDDAFSDYRYDDLYLGRNLGGIYGQQVERRQGGFRAPVSPSFSFGRGNSYLTAFNFDADVPALPAFVPLGVFLDAGYYGFKAFSADPSRGEFNWVGGISLSAFEGRMGVYLPLIADPTTEGFLDQRGGLLERVTFRLNLAGWAPWRWVDRGL